MITGGRSGLRGNRRGSMAMFIVVFMTILITIPLGMQILQVSNRRTIHQIHETVQANNVARAGLVEAISWFRRQAIQPVRASANWAAYPWADAAFFPRAATGDTIDEAIGLVKEYPLNSAGTLWARLEVRRQKDIATNPLDPQAVHDISDKRIPGAAAGDGLAWYLESSGIVFRRKDASRAYNASPNEVVGRARAATEIRRIAIVLPVNAAVTVNSRDTVTCQNNGRIRGGTDTGLAYYTGAAATVSGSGSQIVGATAQADIDGPASGAISLPGLFGVTKSELKLMADFAVSGVNELPGGYPAMAVVFIDGNATFNAARRLRGGGILFVNGNLTINSTTADALFSGLIYVTGTASISGDALISGAVVAEGGLTLNGNGDVAEVDYDLSILNSVRQQVAQYRENKAVFYSFSATK